jgi:hypothetical protein
MSGFGRKLRAALVKLIEPDPTSRVVYTKGPIVRSLEMAASLAGLCAIGALVISLTTFAHSVHKADLKATAATDRANTALAKQQAVQQSRFEAATDTCRTLRQLIDAAYKPQPHKFKVHAIRPSTGAHYELILILPAVKGQAQKVIVADGLQNCEAKAKQEVAIKPSGAGGR